MSKFHVKPFARSKTSLFTLGVLATCAGCTVMLKDKIGGRRFRRNVTMLGKTVVITGGNCGIGKAVAADFAKRGAKVIMGVRNIDEGLNAKADIVQVSYNQNIHVRKLDLSSLSSIEKFCENINQNEKMVHYLVLNAACMGMKKKQVTEDGFEFHFGVNFLGHFLLTNRLLDKINKSSRNGQHCRIISASCDVINKEKSFDFNNINSIKTYDPMKAYRQSKLAMVMFTKELSERLKDKGMNISTFIVDPGWMINSKLHRNIGWQKSWFSRVVSKPFWWLLMWSPSQGAFSTIYATLDPLLEGKSGIYIRDCVETDINDITKDKDASKRLWAISEVWTKIKKNGDVSDKTIPMTEVTNTNV